MRFTTDTGLLISAKRCAGRNGIVRIHPHTAGMNFTTHFHSRIQIRRKYATTKTVYTVIGQSNDFICRLKFLYYYHRSKYFLLTYTTCIISGYQNRRFNKESFITSIIGISFTTGYQLTAFFDADFDIIQYFFLLLCINLCP